MKRKLRPWQNQHLKECINKFARGKKIFLSQAVTGAGKTVLGVSVSNKLIDMGLIARVVVFCPSIEIADGWVSKFGEFGINASRIEIEAPDVVAIVATYAGGKDIPGGPVATLVILDEIHHAEREEAWGLLASDIAGQAKYCLALTGTPWMTVGRIAILDANGYYKSPASGEKPTIVPDAAYKYEEDLRAKDNDRATVPVSFTFFGSEASRVEPAKNGEGPRTESVILEDVTKENRERIGDPKQTNHNTPLGLHVSVDNESLSNNKMARNLLKEAVNKLSSLRASPVYRKGPKPMGLVTCRTIKEARYVKNYMEKSLGQNVELIVSKDDDDSDSKSSNRLRALATNKISNPPAWIVSVGMVSEGVDIPAIKVIAFLNQITTLLYLIQLIGRALRRIEIGLKPDGSPIYADTVLDGTRAFVFAPAHPVIVKVGTELETISNQAVAEKKKESSVEGGGDPDPDGSNGLSGPLDEPKKWTVNNTTHTEFYRGSYITPEWRRCLLAIESDESAMSVLGQFWIGMVLDWIQRELVDEVNEEIQKILKKFNIDPEEVNTETASAGSYDEETTLLRTSAQEINQLIRFAHPKFQKLPDEIAFNKVRQYITEKLLGKKKWKPFSKLSLPQKRQWLEIAKKIKTEECRG